MSPEADLARAVAKALLDYADRKDGVRSGATSSEASLPPVSETATSQRAVLAALATGTQDGLTAREIADRTDVTQFNVYEKLDRLGDMGYVEHVPSASPKRWRLTPQAERLMAGEAGIQPHPAALLLSATANEIREAISWCVETSGEHSQFTSAMESRANSLAHWARDGYPGLKTWSGKQPPPKPQIADYLRRALADGQ